MTTEELPLLGVGLPATGSWATPGSMVAVARRAEELGYASLWTFQRLLSPVDAGPDLSLGLVHDPVVSLAHVAAVTDRIRLGTATLCAPFTAPAVLAKALASLDVLCDGRLTVGLGMGWRPEEYAAAGVPFERRGARFEEYLHCVQALWTQDPVAFDGEFYTVPRSRTGPGPVQRPHPPLLLGGTAPAALRRAGRLAQGWIAGSRHDLATLAGSVAAVRAGAREAGRDPGAVRVLLRGVVDLLDADPGPGRRPLQGTREQVLGDLAALRAQGVTEVFLDLNLSPRVGAPDVDAGAALDLAERVLVAFAPADATSTPSAPTRRRPPSA